jgi:prolyl oligopeptidase
MAIALTSCGEEAKKEEDSSTTDNKMENTENGYPETKKVDHITNYHGTEINDPYQWLENESAPEVAEWVESQRAHTENFLSKIPFRGKIKERLTEIWNFTKRSAPFKEGEFYYYYKNDGVQNQSIVYKANSPDEAGEVFIDPNTFSEDGTKAMNGLQFSKDGKYAGYAVSGAGSDWREFYVKDVTTGELLKDHIQWVKFSGLNWYGDGFFYGRYPEPKKGEEYTAKNTDQSVYYHKVGTDQSEDIQVYADAANPERSFGIGVTKDEAYLLLYSYESTSGNALAFAKTADLSLDGTNVLEESKQKFTPIVEAYEFDYGVIDHIDGGFLVSTNDGAPKKRLVLIDPANPAKSAWKDIIPENEHVLESITKEGDVLIVKYMENVSNRIYLYDLQGNVKNQIELPGLGIVNSITPIKKADHFYFSFVTYTAPNSIYKCEYNTGEYTPFFKPEIDFNSEDYTTKQVFYESKDGTKIPMFITHKKDLVPTDSTPCFLFGYGGFNISYTPEFRVDRTVFMEQGGIYAVANIRGGGEFGSEWHKAGTQAQKQNVFDDFIYACKYLIKEGYTSSEHLAIHGRSNGGLLVGACMTQEPNLFKVAIPKVGVLDMLKFHQFTIGKYWTTDYGCSDNAVDFDYLIKYSPIHNVKEGTEYPATIVVTGDHDDRVVPAHSFKFIAQLQAKQAGENPVLIRIDSAAGHGSGKPIAKQIEEFTDTWAFVFHHLGMEWQ